MKHLRLPLSAVLALLTLFAVAMPVLGYNDPNVRDLRIRRLDPIQCGQPITLEATVWRRGGGTVSGIEVNWSFVAKNNNVIVPGDTLVPATSVSDANGKATTELTLVCVEARRLVQGEHPSDAADRITIECNRRKCAGDDTEEPTTESFLPAGPIDPKMTAGGGSTLATGIQPAAAFTAPQAPLPLNLDLVTLAAVAGTALFLTRVRPLWRAGPRRAHATA